MRPRYLVLVSRDDALEERARRIAETLDLRLRAISPPCAVMTNEACDCLDLGAAGVVLGTLFHRHGAARPLSSFSSTAQSTLERTGLQHLLDCFWGGYVAIDCRERTVEILRDPSGALPCYRASARGAALCASDIDLLFGAGARVARLNWDAVARVLGSGGLPTEETALEGVTMLLPGTSVRLESGREQMVTRWSPWTLVAPDALSAEERSARLHRVVQHCVASWASVFHSPLVSLSGGLDSSIVAACLASANAGKGAGERCLTMFTEDAAGDERGYARELCAALGQPLDECSFDLAAIDIARPLGLHLPRPIGRAQNQSYESAHLAVAQREGTDAFFTGNGGDNVFAFSQSAAALVDRVRTEGWGGGALRTLLDICAQTGAGPIRVLAAARRLSKRPPGYCWKPNLLFLDPGVAAALEALPLRHPWLDAPVGALPGQAAHIAGLVRVQLNLEPERSLFAPVVNPLLSQPVIEACLAIPSWAWRDGGRDRAVARDAFKTKLPAAVVTRRTKGTPDAFLGEIVRRNREAIRSRLLNGELAGHGLLDRDAIERALAPDRLGGGEEDMRLLELANVEAWVSAWVSHLPAPGRPVPPALRPTRSSG